MLAVSLLLLLASEPSAGRGGMRLPPLARSEAPDATDHVAVVEFSVRSEPTMKERWRVKRSGAWQRVDRALAEGEASTFSDFRSKASVSLSVGADERPTSVTVERRPPSDTSYRYRRMRTGAQDQALGERCDVWRTVRIGEDAGLAHDSCLTEDGIELWARTVGAEGEVFSSWRTLSFRRRHVKASEVLPPRNLLDWEYWRMMQGESAKASPRPAVDHTVRFEGRSRYGRPATRTDRRRGNWSSTLVETEGGAIDYSFKAGSVTGGYRAEIGGHPVHLALSLKPKSEAETWPAWAPIVGRPVKHAAGEQCTWSEATGAGGEIVIISGSHATCLTADGIPLAIYSHHRVLYADFTATSVDRTSPPAAEFRLPAPALQWQNWGIRLRR